jgi:hypothetical protein
MNFFPDIVPVKGDVEYAIPDRFFGNQIPELSH